MHIIVLIARQMLLEARQNKIIWLFASVLIVGLGLCEYISSIALIEGRYFQLALYSSLIRWTSIILLLQFVISSFSREVNEKGLDYLLAMPLARSQYIAGKALGIILISALMCAAILAVLSIYQLNASTIVWLSSLYLELVLIGCFALFIAISLPSPALATTVVIGFYILCRTLASIESLASQPLIEHSGFAQSFLAGITELLSYTLPPLYEFARTEWLLYTDFNLSVLITNVIQACIYCSLLLSAACFDLHRKAL